MDLHAFAARVLDALPTASGRVLVRDRCGVVEVVEAVGAEASSRGLSPVVERVDDAVLRSLIGSGPAAIERFYDERTEVSSTVTAVAVLGGRSLDTGGMPEEAVAAWRTAIMRVEHELEAGQVPFVVAAVATPALADELGTSFADLDAFVRGAVLVDPVALTRAVGGVVGALAADPTVVLRTARCELVVDRGARPLLVDDGIVSAADLSVGATVSNLPAGSVYWTVVEDRTRGDVRLVDGTVLTFGDDGRVVDGPWAGERVSHLGIGANPAVTRAVGWTLVDEHRAGAVFLALGENRYLGGENASDVNVDLLPVTPTIPGIVTAGTLVEL